jgi:AAA+ superfamily predicted ATPase
MKFPTQLLADVLSLPKSALCYSLTKRAREVALDLAILETEDYDFNPIAFSQAAGCVLTPREDIHGHWSAEWRDGAMAMKPQTSVMNAVWRNTGLILIRVEVEDYSPYWLILGESIALCERFFVTVCEWCTSAKDAIAVFENSCFSRDQKLYEEIKKRSLHDVFLSDTILNQLQLGVFDFLRQEALFTQHDLPWKRGLILHGPPGNGKTQAIKAIIGETKLPAIYVRSLYHRYDNNESCIRAIFDRAQQLAPCIIVFEDIDALIPAYARSYFLNALDGFRSLSGVLTIATTNHLDKLDVAIKDRPSRFDMKIEFPNPDDAQRYVYLNRSLMKVCRPSLIPSDSLQRAVAATDGFSFAGLQEVVQVCLTRYATAEETKRSLSEILVATCEEMGKAAPTKKGKKQAKKKDKKKSAA